MNERLEIIGTCVQSVIAGELKSEAVTDMYVKHVPELLAQVAETQEELEITREEAWEFNKGSAEIAKELAQAQADNARLRELLGEVLGSERDNPSSPMDIIIALDHANWWVRARTALSTPLKTAVEQGEKV